MADTEQKNETEVTAAAEEAAGAEDTAAEAAAEAGESASAEEPAGPAAGEAPAEDETAAAAETTEEPAAEAAAEAPAEEAPGAAEAVSEEPAAAAEEPAAEEPAAAAEEGAPEEPAAEEAPAVEHTYDSLKGKTVAQMREIAEGLGDHDALHGYTTMHKEELLVALCTALGVEAHEHHEVVGIDKAAVKAKIRDLKQQRTALIEAGDAKQLKIVRRRIRSLKRKIHKATV